MYVYVYVHVYAYVYVNLYVYVYVYVCVVWELKFVIGMCELKWSYASEWYVRVRV